MVWRKGKRPFHACSHNDWSFLFLMVFLLFIVPWFSLFPECRACHSWLLLDTLAVHPVHKPPSRQPCLPPPSFSPQQLVCGVCSQTCSTRALTWCVCNMSCAYCDLISTQKRVIRAWRECRTMGSHFSKANINFIRAISENKSNFSIQCLG